MSRVWIGGSENLKPGDTIVDWSPTRPDGTGVPTIQVERLDPDTIRVVLNEVLERMNSSHALHESWRQTIEAVTKAHGVDL